MAEAAIPVELLNPGQVFACLGLVEAAEILLGDAEGAFNWREPGVTTFLLRAAGDANPVVEVVRYLAEAEIGALSPVGCGLETGKWDVPSPFGMDALLGKPADEQRGDDLCRRTRTNPLTIAAELHARGTLTRGGRWRELAELHLPDRLRLGRRDCFPSGPAIECEHGRQTSA